MLHSNAALAFYPGSGPLLNLVFFVDYADIMS